MDKRSLNFVAAGLLLAAMTSANAGPKDSWNLSRDMMKWGDWVGVAENPMGEGQPLPGTGVWTAMYGTTIGNDSTYWPLDHYHKDFFWLVLDVRNRGVDQPYPFVGMPNETFPHGGTRIRGGVPLLHPGDNEAAIVKWTSPVKGRVSVTARLSDVNRDCGDGVRFYLYHRNTLRAGGFIKNNQGLVTYTAAVNVARTDPLYFIVGSTGDGPGGDAGCDHTALDVLITGPAP